VTGKEPERRHPVVGGDISDICVRADPSDPDSAFAPHNVNKDNECTIISLSRIESTDIVFERDDLAGLRFKDSQLACKSYKSNEACSVTIKMTSKNESYIELYDSTIFSG